MVAVINVDFYPFLAFSVRPDLSALGYRNRCFLMFSGSNLLPDSKETKLGCSDQEASPSAGRNTGVVLVPCCG